KLSLALEHLQEAASHDSSLEDLAGRLDEAKIEAEELALELRDYLRDVEVDPQRLDVVIERMDLISRLQRKHDATDIAELLERADEMRSEIDKLRNVETRTEQLESELTDARRRAFEVALDLGDKRRRAADRLRERVEEELEDLAMEKTTFAVDFAPDPPPEIDELEGRIRADEEAPADGQQSMLEPVILGRRGLDDVEFLLAPNVGEQPRPLAKIASGGELSRIMLAIKSVLVERDDVDTYVFDEVDAGIGGTTADAVGDKIRRTADAHQIVCITHLPQIASRGNHHYRVEKIEDEGRTHTTVEILDESDRVDEIARMLAGQKSGGKAQEAARELIEANP
ncbi:MAG: DNA repair protein RecN, partial [Bradymonadaceae bacterium]